MMVLLREKHNCINGAGFIDEVPTHGRADVNSEHQQIVILRSGTTDAEQKFRLESLDVGIMRCHAGEVVETLTRRKVDVCCIQKVRWRGASARLITGKNSEYKMYWVGNVLGLGGVGILGSGLIRSLM